MNLTVDLLRALADVLQDGAAKYEIHSDDWWMFQDAADALTDLADHLDEQ